jgi:hypothetical protein
MLLFSIAPIRKPALILMEAFTVATTGKLFSGYKNSLEDSSLLWCCTVSDCGAFIFVPGAGQLDPEAEGMTVPRNSCENITCNKYAFI